MLMKSVGELSVNKILRLLTCTGFEFYCWPWPLCLFKLGLLASFFVFALAVLNVASSHFSLSLPLLIPRVQSTKCIGWV